MIVVEHATIFMELASHQNLYPMIRST